MPVMGLVAESISTSKILLLTAVVMTGANTWRIRCVAALLAGSTLCNWAWLVHFDTSLKFYQIGLGILSVFTQQECLLLHIYRL